MVWLIKPLASDVIKILKNFEHERETLVFAFGEDRAKDYLGDGY